MRSGGSSNKPPVGIERDSEAQGLENGEAGIGIYLQYLPKNSKFWSLPI